MVSRQQEKQHSSPKHKKKVLGEIFTKLEKASLGCGEIDLPLFGEILLTKLEEIASEFAPNNIAWQEMKERVEKIKNCVPNPDYHIYMAKVICQKLLEEMQ